MIKRILIIAIASAALLLGTTMYAQKPEKKEPEDKALGWKRGCHRGQHSIS
jgi:hypothetical protein